MQYPYYIISRIIIFFFVGVLNFQSVFAQARKTGAAARPPVSARENVTIKKIEGVSAAGMIKTPKYIVETKEENKVSRQWARISVRYDTKRDWTDALEFRYFVLTKNPRAKIKANQYMLFTATVTYVDIAKGRHVSTVFLRPNTVKRYGYVEKVAVEIWSGGEQVAVSCSPTAKQMWWQMIAGKVKTIQGVLLNRSQTPFVFVGYDGHEAIKEK